MTQRVALITKKYLLAHQKSIFKMEIFSLEIEVKKIPLKMENKIC